MATTVQGSITSTNWGSVNGQEIKKFTLRNGASQEVDVITYGATLTAIRTPDKEGNIADVVLGFDNIEGIVITVYIKEYLIRCLFYPINFIAYLINIKR